MLGQHFQSFLEYLQYEKKYSAHTIVSYNNDLTQFFGFINAEKEGISISEINYQLVRAWIADLMANDIAAKSVNRKLSALKTFFKYLQKQGEIKVNPLSKITGPKTPKRLPVFVDESQMNTLFDELKFEDSFTGMRDRLILDILYQTGVRRSELAALKESDIDFFNATIKVLGKRNKERIIPISLTLKRNLEEYFKVKEVNSPFNSLIFVTEKGKSLGDQGVYRIVKKYLTQITTITKKSPHVLRHTFATHLLNNGADINAVKDLLGHASLSATQVYTHNTIEKLKKSYKQAHPRGDI